MECPGGNGAHLGTLIFEGREAQGLSSVLGYPQPALVVELDQTDSRDSRLDSIYLKRDGSI